MNQYEVRFSRRTRSMRITVRVDGSVLVTVPHYIRTDRIAAFVEARREWIERARAKMARRGPLTELPKGKRVYQAQREYARACVHELLEEFKSIFAYKKIRIMNAKTRWGSCSTRGTLSFNWHIIYLPREVQRYLVVHELTHLIHHNHSQSFWNAVCTYDPDYRRHTRELKRFHF